MNAPETLSPGLRQWRLGTYPEQAAFSPDASRAAFALSDGRLAVLDLPQGAAEYFQVHQGSCLCVAAHPSGGWITGGDDGLLAYVSPSGEVAEITKGTGAWVEHMSASADGTVLAASLGREAVVLDLSAGSMAVLGPHSSSISGLAVSPAGGVLAVTRAGGVSLWDLGEAREPVELDLPGLSIAPAFSPDAAYLALGHQERAVNIVELETRKVFGLAGLPAKPGRLSWAHDGSHLLHSGTKAVICWPVPGCFQQDPQPVAFAVREDTRMCALAANPRIPFAACGFDDGTLLLAELRRFAAFHLDAEPGCPVSALAWSAQGLHLACAMEDGRALVLDLGEMLSAG